MTNRTDSQVALREIWGFGGLDDSIIEKVKLKGKKISFRHENDSLYLENAGVKEKENRLNIQFKGIPKDGLIIGKNKYGDRTFFADNWPTRAQNWFVKKHWVP